MRYSLFALLLPTFVLAACQGTAPPAPDPADRCGAGALQHLVGQPGSVLQGMRFSQPLRVIGYGMAVTMDYNPDRLNIALDQRDRIERVSCG